MDNLIIRPVTPDDAPRLLEIYGWYVVHSAVTYEYDVPSPGEFRQRIVHTLEKYPYFAAELDGEILGYAYAGAFHPRAAYGWAAELSVYIDHRARGRGIGAALYAALEDALSRMGILNLYACISWPETEDEYLDRSSQRFHARRGFVTVGEFHNCGYKFGRWYSMIWMEKIIGGHVSPPTEIIPYPSIKD